MIFRGNIFSDIQSVCDNNFTFCKSVENGKNTREEQLDSYLLSLMEMQINDVISLFTQLKNITISGYCKSTKFDYDITKHDSIESVVCLLPNQEILLPSSVDKLHTIVTLSYPNFIINRSFLRLCSRELIISRDSKNNAELYIYKYFRNTYGFITNQEIYGRINWQYKSPLDCTLEIR